MNLYDSQTVPKEPHKPLRPLTPLQWAGIIIGVLMILEVLREVTVRSSSGQSIWR
jgi:hypothetical protein